MNVDLSKLETENQNVDTMEIDNVPTEEVVRLINQADATVAYAVQKKLPEIAALVDVIADRIRKGGRLFYIGAGTSGRLGFLDASECPPTYGVDYELVQGIMAGGFTALYKAKEGAEDDAVQAVEDCKERNLNEKDVLVGIAASGRTPYVIGALEYANSLGCATGSVACVSNSKIGQIAQYPIDVVTGQEVVTGSTRMKAGTAQKMVLNMISTAVFINLGKTYGNLMVDVKPTNEKLVERAKNTIIKATGCDRETAEKLFEESDRSVKLAICMHETGLDKESAQILLEKNEGHLRRALNAFNI